MQGSHRHTRSWPIRLAALLALLLTTFASLFTTPQLTVLAASDPGLLISEFLANPTSNDTNQEYVELIATKAIDFSVTPYSVVFSNNGTATANGWINGASISYGFNITSGTVNRGDVVYVGGSGMAPTGTKLRVIDVTNTAGDRFGSAQATSGVLGNGGANADGIAVFNVDISSLTNSTVPVDMIFFGTGTGTAVVNSGADGYQLPINDRYIGGKLQSTSFLASDPASAQVTIATGTFNTATGEYTVARTWANSTSPTNNASAVTLESTPPTNPTVTLSVSPSSASEAALTAVTVTATASAAVSGDQTVSLAVSGSGITSGDYTLSSSTITIPNGQTTGSVTFTVVDDTDVEGAETATLTISGPSAGIALGATTTQSVTIDDNDSPPPVGCAASFTPIYAIQGSGTAAAITGDVTTQGVVVGDFEGAAPNLGGFYLQDPSGDGNSETSDGIFVYYNSGEIVQAGDLVRVTGYARERFNQTTLNGSNSNTAPVLAANITICSSGNALPAAADVTFPLTSSTALERFEGMRVNLSQQLTILEYYNYDQFGEMVIGYPDDIAELEGIGRFFTPTNIVEPGTAATALAAQYALRRITLDDTLSGSNPATLRHPNGDSFSLTNRFRGGDKVQNVVGVLGYDFNLYRIQPTGPAQFTAINPRPTTRENVGGRLQVASFNTLNYFLTADYPSGNALDNKCGPSQNVECRGWDSDQPDELTRQRDKLIQAIRGIDADVLGLNELENTTGVEPLADIVAGLNAIPGGDTYAYINTGTIGTDAIKVGIIYKPAVVTPVGAYQVLTTSVDPRFIDTRNRPALAQTFVENASGARFTVVANHLKSKGSSCGAGDDDTTGGQGNCNGTRTNAAKALVDWLATDPTGSGDPDFLIMGDLNSYAKEDPIDAILAGADDTAGSSDDWTNLTAQFKGRFAYSYVFDGQLGYLDHALGNASITTQVVGVTEWHINADESDVFDYDTTYKPAGQEALYEVNAFRTSDHDPVVIGLNLTVPNAAPALSAVARFGAATGINGAEIIDIRGNRAVLTDAGNSTVYVLDTTDLLDIKLLTSVTGLTGLNSAAIHPTQDYFLAVAGTSKPAAAPANGTVYAYTLDGTLIASAEAGILPDSVAIAPNGSYAVIANEAEGYASGDNGGPGSLSVVSLAGFDPATSTSLSVTQIALPNLNGTPGFTSARSDDMGRLEITNAPETLEPESVSFSADSQYAYVSMQENNAVVRVTLADNSLTFFGLGKTTHPVDASTSGGFSPTQVLSLFREPDGIAVIEINGTRYFVTADEGDTYNDIPTGAISGRVRGGRTVSVFNAETGAVVGDTGNQLDTLAARYGLYDDGRSNRGGAEPEVLDAKVFGGRAIVAVGLERAGSVALVDITDPAAPNAFLLLPAGTNPEGIKLVARGDTLYVLAANEVSNDLTVAVVPTGAFNLFQTYAESTPLALHDLRVIDPDTGDSVTVELSLDLAAGTLSGTSLTDLGNGQYSLSGTLAEVNAALAALTFNPNNTIASYVLSAVASDGTASTLIGRITLQAIDTTITGQPTALSNSAEATFAFSGQLGSQTLSAFECSLDGVAFAPCSSGETYSSLAEGSHTFAVRAVDGMGNVDATPASYGWTVDTSAPVVTISSGPASPINSGAASFSFSSAANDVAGFECKLDSADSADFAGCTSPVNFPGLSVGDHTFAVRATDNAGNVGEATTYTWEINQATTTTSFTTTANPASTGQELIFKATVAVVAPGVGTPDGSVTFKSGGAPIAGCSAVALSAGVAQCSTSFATAGNYTISVDYAGSTYFQASTSAPGVQVVNVGSTTTVSSSINPSFFGQSVTFTANVSAGAGPRLTGRVTFLDGTIVLATRNLSSGSASFTTKSLGAGSHSITAIYSGNTNIGGSVSPSITQVVNQAVTSTTLTASLNPAVIGQAVKLTATVATVSGVGTATGTVTFYEGTTVVGSVALSGGKANLTVRLPVGSHNITAVYGGSTNFAGSNSADLALVVNKAVTTTALASSRNPAPVGRSVTFTATVKVVSPGTGTPTGTVTFYDGATPLATVALVGNKATFTTSTLTSGTHAIIAVYSGDASYLTSTSATRTQRVR